MVTSVFKLKRSFFFNNQYIRKPKWSRLLGEILKDLFNHQYNRRYFCQNIAVIEVILWFRNTDYKSTVWWALLVFNAFAIFYTTLLTNLATLSDVIGLLLWNWNVYCSRLVFVLTILSNSVVIEGAIIKRFIWFCRR